MQTEKTENIDLESKKEVTTAFDENVTDNENNNENSIETTEVQTEELSEVEKAKIELAEMKDKYIRMYSEFENFRRRTAKEKVELIHNASQNLLRELIPVVDDFERAQTSFENAVDVESVKEGVDLIFNKLNTILKRQGLTPMDSKGTDFDVELHECITQLDATDEMKGKVVDVVEKGYLLNDKVIRYAKVVVGK